jgi:hypothetical protein
MERDRWARFVERLLPWFDPARERVRDARTEAIRQHSILERIRAERTLASYRDLRLRR